MLKNLHKIDTKKNTVRMADIDTTQPFRQGLEYSAPARGAWTIAHTSMLIPHSHQIFVCPDGCLRGVVLSAAEYGGLDRFSMVTVKEEDFFNEKMEKLFIDGITDILEHLPKMPPAVLVYSCCIQRFMGTDLSYVFKTLRGRFPDTDILECFMLPTMRKSKYTPDELMWRSLYEGLKPMEKNPRAVNIIGSDFPFDEENDLAQMLTKGGYVLHDLTRCREYAEYLQMGESTANITTSRVSGAAAEELEERLGQKALYYPAVYDFNGIDEELRDAAEFFGTGIPEIRAERFKTKEALGHLKDVLCGRTVAVDYTATFRPLGLAALLIAHGISVSGIYADTILPEEEAALLYLKAHAPDLELNATINFRSRLESRDAGEKAPEGILAVGQKAAYFTGTKHFVNLIQDGGLWGYYGIRELCRRMEEASKMESDVRSIISVKGWGCCG